MLFFFGNLLNLTDYEKGTKFGALFFWVLRFLPEREFPESIFPESILPESLYKVHFTRK